MSGCCQPADYGKVFGASTARRDARRYRRRGLGGTAELLAGWLAPHAPGATVLEVGGGVGALQLELLQAGAARAVNVELSPEYEAAARDLAGGDDRMERVVADFVASDDLREADLVVLHRVVCCYPDGEAMVAKAATATRSTLAMTYPRDTWWVRAAMKLGNTLFRLLRSSFRVYVHDPEMLHGVAANHGLTTTRRAHGLVWESTLCIRS